MDPSLQFLRFSSQRRREKEELEIQRFIGNGKRSRQLFLQQENEDLEMEEALALAWLSKKPRLERSANEERENSWRKLGYRRWDDSAFKKRLRISCDTFEFILGEIRDSIVKERFLPFPCGSHFVSLRPRWNATFSTLSASR